MKHNIMRAALSVALALGAVLGTGVGNASAHASIQLYGERATPGGYGVVFIRIPHGCTGGLTTDRVVVSIPTGFASVRPQLIPGWTASRTMVGTTITEVQWSGGALKNSEFADFGISVRYPTTAGTYGMKVVQHCGSMTTTWDGADLPSLVVAPMQPDYPVAVAIAEHDGAMKIVLDASTVHAGDRITAHVKVDGKTVRKMAITLDDRGDAVTELAMKGVTPKGTRYRILEGAVVDVTLDKLLVGSATLGAATGTASSGHSH